MRKECPSCGTISLISVGHWSPAKTEYSWKCGNCGLVSEIKPTQQLAFKSLQDALVDKVDEEEAEVAAGLEDETSSVTVVPDGIVVDESLEGVDETPKTAAEARIEDKPVRTFSNPNRKKTNTKK